MSVGFFALLYFTGRSPVRLWLAKQNWKQVPCTIIESGIDSERSRSKRQRSGRTRHYITTTYEYEWNGEQFRSERFRPSGTWRYVGKIARLDPMLRNLSPGAKAVCRVNPSNPYQAAINLDYTASDVIPPLIFPPMLLFLACLFFYGAYNPKHHK